MSEHTRTYHEYELDPFQEEALQAIDAGKSVIVAAPTGTGKTLVADYLIEKAMNEHLRVIYTAPIKALSNQKYRDFKKLFGEDSVGIMTGDVVLNPTAPLLIMTTEVFRNQVITEDPNLEFVSHIVFDEIHWLNDEERGTVWEESIILAPPRMKILGLSATIANARQLVDWIESIRHEDVVLIEEHKRVVPLEYFYFTKDTGLVNYEQLWRYYRQRLKNHKGEESPFSPTTHLDLVRAIQRNNLPILFFVFSRKQCALKAMELASIANYLKAPERRLVEEKFLQVFGPESEWSQSTRQLKRLCSKGIAYHHAGLLPSQKVVVEELFLERLLKVLYCTETFSVGINYPVKAVCFDSLNKYDGRNFRPLANHEFFQMSGRAGRRGIDEKGYSFAIVDLSYMEKSPPPKFQLNRLEPLTSQFRLTYNTVLNLTATLNREQIETYFQKSFAAFSYRLNSEHLSRDLAQLETRLAEAGQDMCEEVGSFKCPLKYQPKHKELTKLRLAYKALGPRKQNRAYGRAMARRIKTWEKLLAHSPKDCQAHQLEICQKYGKSYLALKQQQKDLLDSLEALPEENAFLREFESKKNHLHQIGYLRENELLPRGLCASRIYVQELLVTELIYSDVFPGLDDDQLNALISSIDFEARKNDYFQRSTVFDPAPVKGIIDYIQGFCGEGTVRFDPRVSGMTYAWSQGQSFREVQTMCNLDEGDIISVFRRSIDLLRQMREAVSDPALRARLKVCMEKLDRDEAAIMEL